jgi:hypothetical protein
MSMQIADMDECHFAVTGACRVGCGRNAGREEISKAAQDVRSHGAL